MWTITKCFNADENPKCWTYCSTLLLLFLMSIQVYAQNGWTRKANVPTPRACASASVVNDRIHVMGGVQSNWVDFAVHEVYDPLTDTWETRESMPTARSVLLTCVLRDSIYAIGGGYPTARDKVEVYDPITDTWSTKAHMIHPWFGVYGDTVNGKIYTFGGYYDRQNSFEYDPSSNQWKEKNPIPSGRCAGPLSPVGHNGLVYVFGGTAKYPHSGTTDPKEPLSTVDVYNPETDTWDTTRTNMPTPRYAMRTFLVDGKIYVIGGTQAWGTALSTVEVYDPVNDTWESKPDMPFRSCYFCGAVCNGKIYVFGGTADWATGGIEVWEYDPLATEVVEHEKVTPTEFALYQNYPNPFNPKTIIHSQLSMDSWVTLAVYDLLGREVDVLVNERRGAGRYQDSFDASGLASGMYFYRLTAGPYVETRTMLLMK